MKKTALVLILVLMLTSAFACATTPEVTPSPTGTVAALPAEETAPAASPETSPAASPEVSPDGTIPEASPDTSPGASPGAGITASAKGYGGDVTATLTLVDGNIGDFYLEGPNETEGVGKAALETYNKTLSELKGKPLSGFDPSKLDTVSGATVTSTAAKTVLADVMSKAG